MGNMESGREFVKQQERRQLNSFLNNLSDGPDLTVNLRMQNFTGLSASDNLRQHYEWRKLQAGLHAAEWSKSLVEKLGNLPKPPELTGLLALVIAILIDIVSGSPPEESTKDSLRSVFAEEKASEVWDQIDECLKRCKMHINNRDELVSDLKWIERHLSAAITKLKNSMVRDGHMSNQALRAWVNGAAFHVQMLIHLMRLGGIQTQDPVERLISLYLTDLELLFNKHKAMIEGKCRMEGGAVQVYYFPLYLVGEDAKYNYIPMGGVYETYLQAYYDHRYGQQKREIQHYFSDINQNLQELVQQQGSFNINREADGSEEVHHMAQGCDRSTCSSEPGLCVQQQFY